MSKLFFSFGSVLAFFAVAAGALGGHVLKSRLSDYHLEFFEIASRYHMYHAKLAGWLFIMGIVIFSGSLYLLSITNYRWLGAITPIGGTAFMFGWICLAISPWHKSAQSN